MTSTPSWPDEKELYEKLKAIMLMRLVFSTVLLGSTTLLHLRESPSPLAKPLLFLYGLIAAIFLLSLSYAVLLERIRNLKAFAYFQTVMDTFIVTVIVYITGSYSSVFSFLYLVVIFYVHLLPFEKIGFLAAGVSSLQYGLMIDLEYFGILTPLDPSQYTGAARFVWNHVFFKVMITMAACFCVALLGRVMARQGRRHRERARAMEERAKRMEKLAAVGEMAAGLAHEIKNPLASLRGSIQMLNEELPLDKTSEKLMQIVLREADRMSTLVNNFLMFARPPAARPQPIDLAATLEEIIDLFEKDKICVGRIEISKQLVPQIWIEMDAVQLRQVLWNLLLNAAESIRESGRIEVATSPGKNGRVEVRISDTGAGIAPQHRATIFDPFFSTKSNGTGLGLSIVHRILDAHAAWLDYDSEIGVGTTFRLSLDTIPAPT
jgi:two-component system sensor histidine kinase PilS (NtrC family)